MQVQRHVTIHSTINSPRFRPREGHLNRSCNSNTRRYRYGASSHCRDRSVANYKGKICDVSHQEYRHCVLFIQGGSNMTGTDVARFTHKSVPVIFEPPCICIDGVSKHNNVDQKIALVCDLFECNLKCTFLLANRLAQIDYVFYLMESLLVSFNCGLCKEALKKLILSETAVAQWLRYCATNWKVAGSIQMVLLEFFIDIILPITLWPWCRLSL